MKRNSKDKIETTRKKTRVSLDLSPELYARLERLEKLAGAESKATVVRQALQLYEFIIERTVEGGKFRMVTPDGKEEGLVFIGPAIKH